ncbi:hypothetical protein LINPERHAP1_LOCUS16122 [Linum perenne]
MYQSVPHFLSPHRRHRRSTKNKATDNIKMGSAGRFSWFNWVNARFDYLPQNRLPVTKSWSAHARTG